MEDEKIKQLYFCGDEAAIAETQNKYSNYLMSIALNILSSSEDAKECVNGAYLKAWNSIPTKKPENLKIYLGRIVRNSAIDMRKAQSAEKRGGGKTAVVLDEISEFVPDGKGDISDEIAVRDALSRFIRSLSDEKARVFVRRYWYVSSVSEIARDFSMSESKVKSILHRTGKELKSFLEKEGIAL